MKQIKTLNKPKNQKNLLEKSNNLLNSQNYILGKNEKNKVLTSFLGTEVLKKVLWKLWYFYFVIFLLWWIYLYILNSSFILVSISFFITWFFSFTNYKITNLKNYFYISNKNVWNILLIISLVFIIIVWIFIFFTNYFKNNFPQLYLKYFIVFFFILIFFFIVIIESRKIEFINYNWKLINVINILLLPIIFPLWLLIYLIMYIFSTLQKYNITKYNPIKKSILNFIETNWIFSNWLYEISKK